MQRYRLSAICASTILAVGLAMMCHEMAHIVAGRLAGGTPTLLTTTEVLGNFDSLSGAGLVALGASGSVMNVLLCALGWIVLERRPASQELRLTAWFFFAINGMLVTTKMMVEAVTGFGDWMTILRPLPSTTLARILVAVIGTAGVAFMVRRSGPALARIVPADDPAHRRAEAFRIVTVAAIAAMILVLGGSLANPVGTTRGSLLAVGAGLGPFVPITMGLRFVSRTPSQIEGPLVSDGWPWLVAASIVVAVMWFVIGPGVTLWKGVPA
jgi:hypothetical protein